MARVLVVDDEPNVRRSFVMFLRHGGHEVEAVGDSQSALAKLEGSSMNADAVAILDSWLTTNDPIVVDTTALAYQNFHTANVPDATTSLKGKVELADQTETEADDIASFKARWGSRLTDITREDSG